MKTLVFSDTHFSDKFNQKLFDYIAKLVKSADQVIINGDFWDAYLVSFEEFCNSEWQKLFALLKKKKAVYIFGNHDQEEYMDEKYNLFSDLQTLKYSFQSGKKKVTIEHGHLIAPSENQLFPFLKPDIMRRFFTAITRIYEAYLPLKKIFDFLYQNTISSHHQREIKRTVLDKSSLDTIYIFGHTHIYEYDVRINFISCAMTQSAQYSCVFIENGKITPVFQDF